MPMQLRDQEIQANKKEPMRWGRGLNYIINQQDILLSPSNHHKSLHYFRIALLSQMSCNSCECDFGINRCPESDKKIACDQQNCHFASTRSLCLICTGTEIELLILPHIYLLYTYLLCVDNVSLCKISILSFHPSRLPPPLCLIVFHMELKPSISACGRHHFTSTNTTLQLVISLLII